jgi:ParB family chromosome partitioning protein
MERTTETSKKRTALGLGLDALIPLNQPQSKSLSDRDVTKVPVDSLVPGPFQPRTSFQVEALDELTKSIQSMGIIQPIIVRETGSNTFEIVAGERRWRAAQKAGLKTVPVIVRKLSDLESLEIAIIENIQREDLNPLETAEAYDLLIKKFSYTHDNLAQRLGKDRTSITNYLRLLRLPDPLKEDLRRDRLSMGHAKTLLGIEDISTQLSLGKRAVTKKLSVRDLERIVQNYKNKVSKPCVVGNRNLAPDLMELEKYFCSQLSARVFVKPNGKGGGKIEINFHSRDELLRIVDILCSNEVSS